MSVSGLLALHALTALCLNNNLLGTAAADGSAALFEACSEAALDGSAQDAGGAGGPCKDGASDADAARSSACSRGAADSQGKGHNSCSTAPAQEAVSTTNASGGAAQPHAGLRELRLLQLASNRLTSIGPSVICFAALPALRSLFLQGNHIQRIDGLSCLHHLEELVRATRSCFSLLFGMLVFAPPVSLSCFDLVQYVPACHGKTPDIDRTHAHRCSTATASSASTPTRLSASPRFVTSASATMHCALCRK